MGGESGGGGRYLFKGKTGIGIFLLLILVTFYNYSQQRVFNTESQSYWNVLENFPSILTLKFNDRHSKITLAASNKSDMADFSRQTVKRFSIRMKSIKKMLEKCSIGEAVSIYIYTQNSKSIINLGTFYPKILNQKQVLFKIPKNIEQSISFVQFRHILLEYLKNNKGFDDPIECRIRFNDQSNHVRAELRVNCIFSLQIDSDYLQFFNLLKKEWLHKSEKYCEKMDGIDKTVCFYILADFLFFKKSYDQAGYYYSLINEKSKLKEIGDIYLQAGQFEKSMAYYGKLPPSPIIARQFGKLGDIFKKEKKISLAKTCYQKAINQFKFLLKSFLYPWDDKYFKDMRRCVQVKKQLPRSSEEEKRHQTKLEILKNTADYCKRVKGSSFLFFCSEVITEINKGNKNRYVYDYQLIKEGQELKESKKQTNEDSGIRFGGISYENKYIIFGPNGLIGSYWQDFYDYEILEEVTSNGEHFFIVEALPVFPQKVNNLFGKLWINAKDYSISKIRWYGKSLSNSRKIEDYAFKRGVKPSITFYTEYNIQKNGLRFPTKHYLEEAYFKRDNKKYIKSKTIVLYKDYHFFYVDTDVVSIKPKKNITDH